MQGNDIFENMKNFLQLDTTTARPRGRKRVTRSFSMEGELRSGTESIFSINGQDFVTLSSTWTFGAVSLGTNVVVQGVVLQDGTFAAKTIAVKKTCIHKKELQNNHRPVDC